MKKLLIFLFTVISLHTNAQCNDTIIVPNAFTPIGDKNKTFYPFIGEYTDYQISIYNRWGNLIYLGKEWNGTFNNNLCESGLYIWVVKVTRYDCENYFNGTVLLIK